MAGSSDIRYPTSDILCDTLLSDIRYTTSDILWCDTLLAVTSYQEMTQPVASSHDSACYVLSWMPPTSPI